MDSKLCSFTTPPVCPLPPSSSSSSSPSQPPFPPSVTITKCTTSTAPRRNSQINVRFLFLSLSPSCRLLVSSLFLVFIEAIEMLPYVTYVRREKERKDVIPSRESHFESTGNDISPRVSDVPFRKRREGCLDTYISLAKQDER